MLDVTAFTEDEEWRDCVFPEYSSDLGVGVTLAERCVYCDGEWYRKV
jgi:hypothetical protein